MMTCNGVSLSHGFSVQAVSASLVSTIGHADGTP
jgi:hypothetical protein